MATWLNTCFRTQFRVVDGLKAFAGRARRELPAAGEPFASAPPGRPGS